MFAAAGLPTTPARRLHRLAVPCCPCLAADAALLLQIAFHVRPPLVADCDVFFRRQMKLVDWGVPLPTAIGMG